MTADSPEGADSHLPSTVEPAISELDTNLRALAAKRHPELASALARVFGAIAAEATRTPRFAASLSDALAGADLTSIARPPHRTSARRKPGPFDPFAVYASASEAGLRDRLSKLELDQLRDIIAEHGMDTDRLAMKWKDPRRVVDRIVDRVIARATKGAAFR